MKNKYKKEESMTKYFANGCSCKLSENGFLKLKCIKGQCNVCIFSPMYDLSCFKHQGVAKFHLFVIEEYAYLSGKLNLVNGSLEKILMNQFRNLSPNLTASGLLIFASI